MSPGNDQPPVPPPSPTGIQPPTRESSAGSRFSLASIALGLSIFSPVPCCPFVGFLSTPLAIVSLWQLRAGEDHRSRRLARAALVLSLVGLVVQAVTYESLSAWLKRDLDRNMSDCIQAAFADDYPKCVIAIEANPLAPPARAAPTKEQLAAFSAEAAKRYGELQNVSFISQVGDGGMLDVAMTSAITLRFARRETTGSVVFQLVPQSERWIPATRLIELTVDDSTLGDLVLAPPAAAPATPAIQPK